MQTKAPAKEVFSLEAVKRVGINRWHALTESQKTFIKRAWGVLTYKWRWQIALNIPYLIIFGLDRAIPAVHKFDMALIASVISRIPLHEMVSKWINIS